MAYGIGSTSKGRSGAAASIATGAVAITSGSTICVGVGWSNAIAFTSVTDSVGNTYTQAGVERAPSAGTDHARLYYCQNAIGGASVTATLTVASSTNLEILLVELTGMAAASFDQQNSNPDTATPFTSGNITTTTARQILVSLIIGDSGSNPATHAESTGFTVQSGAEETNGASFWTGALATRPVTAIGTYGSSFTETGATRAAVFIASFIERPEMGARRGIGPGQGPQVKNRVLARSTRSFESVPAAVDVTVALTGQSYTYSAGTLASSRTVSLAGSAYTYSTGSLTPSNALPLAGAAETYATGALAPSATIALAGTQYTWATDTITASTGGDLTLALTGQSYGYSAGTLAPSSTVALTGSAETYSAGAIAVNHAQPLAGIAEAYSTGVMSPATTISIAGQLVSFSSGTMTAEAGGDVTVALTGIQLSWVAGNLIASGADSAEQPSGGYFNDFDAHASRRRKRKREEEERLEEAQQIQAELDREIARLLHEQEAKDAERADLQRLQSIADRYVGTRQPVTKRVSTALLKAYEERSRNALEQFHREMERMLEEDEIAVMLILNQ